FAFSLIAFYFIIETFSFANIAIREYSLVMNFNNKTRILLENYKTNAEDLETIISNTEHLGFFTVILSNAGVVLARSKNVNKSSGRICINEMNGQVDPSKCFKDYHTGMKITESSLHEISQKVKLYSVKNGDFQLIENGILYHIAFSHLQNGNAIVTIIPNPSEKPEAYIRSIAFSALVLMSSVFYFLVYIVSNITFKKTGQTIG
ncbi:MAG: hypothetical protein K8R21_01630, partial [Leptospira sp.]|nr:hypothetical protein [Leptospira sp.]